MRHVISVLFGESKLGYFFLKVNKISLQEIVKSISLQKLTAIYAARPIRSIFEMDSIAFMNFNLLRRAIGALIRVK
jgi:hypothetical protein